MKLKDIDKIMAVVIYTIKRRFSNLCLPIAYLPPLSKFGVSDMSLFARRRGGFIELAGSCSTITRWRYSSKWGSSVGKKFQLMGHYLLKGEHSMVKYLKLARIRALPAFSFTFVIPFAVGAYAETSWTQALIGFASLLLFASFAFALNFYSDRDTDRLHDGRQKDTNLRLQPMVTGEVTERECKVFCIVTLVISILLGFLVGITFALLVIFSCLVGGILYSHPKIRLKAKPLGDILCISLLGLLVPSAGYLLGYGVLPTPLMMLFWFLVTATGYTATVMSDYEFDIKAGLRTSAVFFGKGGLLKIMVVGCTLSLVVAFFIFRDTHMYPVGTRYFAVIALAIVIMLTAGIWISLNRHRMHLPSIFSLIRRAFMRKRLIELKAMLWRSHRPTGIQPTTARHRGRWIFITPGVIALAFLIYAYVKTSSGSYYLPWDPFWVP
jgi:4-hydroxybenzoate polyprenyltransferase